MNPRYRATARRHRVLFALIILLCAFLGLAQALGASKSYRSDATLSFPSLSAQSSITTPPAAQSQEMLNELLATRAFPRFVAKNSSLGAYLKHHSSSGTGPITILKELMKGSPTYDERIAAALGPKRVTSMPSGPELLSVSFEAPNPVLAQTTLEVLIKHFVTERNSLQRVAITAANDQFGTAHRQLTQAQHDLNSYTRSHPASSTNGDPEVKALSNAVQQATTQLSAAAGAVATATQNSGVAPTGYRLIDAPNRPVGPTTGKKRVGELTIVGAFLGGLICFGLIALMSRGAGEEPPTPSRPANLPEHSPNGNSGSTEHEPVHEVLVGERSSEQPPE
jgi:hypothetical protein